MRNISLGKSRAFTQEYGECASERTGTHLLLLVKFRSNSSIPWTVPSPMFNQQLRSFQIENTCVYGALETGYNIPVEGSTKKQHKFCRNAYSNIRQKRYPELFSDASPNESIANPAERWLQQSLSEPENPPASSGQSLLHNDNVPMRPLQFYSVGYSKRKCHVN